MRKNKKLVTLLVALMACATMSATAGCMDSVMSGLTPPESTVESTGNEASSEETSSSEEQSSVEETAKYTVTFKDEDGTVLQTGEVEEGEMPVYAGLTPSKDATAQYTYTFTGWDSELVAVTGATVYTAVYEATVNKYTVTFKDENGTTLQTSQVEYGTTPEYTGTPTKAATAQYTYTFAGWNTAVVPVTGEAT